MLLELLNELEDLFLLYGYIRHKFDYIKYDLKE